MNALSSILVTPSGTVMLVSDLQAWNVPRSIEVMLFAFIPEHEAEFVFTGVRIGDAEAEFCSDRLAAADGVGGRQKPLVGVIEHCPVFDGDPVRRIDDAPGGVFEVI